MADDSVNQYKPSSDFKDDKGGVNLYPMPIIGIVKHNVDSAKTGKIKVLLKRMNGAYPEDIEDNWTGVSYMSPFFGYTPNTASSDGYGSYAGNPHSYGFWATPPDLGTKVLCIFVNGDPNFGYYIGCIPTPGMNHMVPGIGAEDNVILNKGEAQTYGGATKLPVGEINNANPKQATSGTLSKQPRPVHSYQAAVYNKQGLLRDKDRGPISSSAQRESPSRVFGISTPGRPIYAGGFTDDNIKAAINNSSVPDKALEVTGRIGGHTFVMDDGDVAGNDQLIRLRTASGHTILMNDAAQTLFLIHANGQSYIELGKEGTIDMYATNSVNIRSQGDLNLHADRDININANRDLNVMGVNMHLESQKNTTFFTGKTMNTTVLGNHTEHVGGVLSMQAMNSAGLSSVLGPVFIKGTLVNLNSGMCPAVPMPAPQLPRTLHTDTLYDSKIGYAAAPQKLSSIVSRAPAHAPWAAAGKGVALQTNLSASGNAPETPSPAISQLNASVSSSPSSPTNPSLMSTVPATSAVSSGSIDSATASAMASQMAVTAATSPGGAAVQATAGVVNTGTGLKASVGLFGSSPSQLVSQGIMKPGSDVAANAGIASGLGIQAAMPPNMFTGKNGINSVSDLVNNVPAQTNIAVDSLNSAKTTLTNLGAITGKESLTQTGGLIMATAIAGPAKALSYAQSQISGAFSDSFKGLGSSFSGVGEGGISNLGSSLGAGFDSFGTNLSSGFSNLGTNLSTSFTNIGTNISESFSGLQDKFTGLASGTGSSMDSLFSGGLFASISVQEKLNTSLVDTLIKTLQGAALAAFAQVVSGYRSLPADRPISLAAENSGNAELQAINDYLGIGDTNKAATMGDASLTDVMNAAKADAESKVDSSFTIKNAYGDTYQSPTATTGKTDYNDEVMGGLPGGLASVSNVTQDGQTDLTAIPGVGQIVDAITAAATEMDSQGASSGSEGPSMLTKVLAVGGLALTVSSTLSKLGGSQLSGVLGSLGLPGGPFQTKLPTMASGTMSIDSIKAKSASLLGDAKTKLNINGKESKTDAETLAENKKLKQIEQASNEQDRAHDYWRTQVDKHGASSPEALTAYAEYKSKQAAVSSVTG